MLNGADYRSILAFLDALYGQHDLEKFPGWLVRVLPGLVGSHHCTWNEMAFSVPRAVVVEYPVLDRLEARMEAFSRYLYQHPGVVHSLSTGDPGPFVVSDLISDQALHRLELYQHLFRRMGYEDQIGMALTPPCGELASVSVARDRRGVSRRDREIMALVRPHLVRAHANLRALARARSSLEEDGQADGSGVSVALLVIGTGGRVWRGLPRAQPLLDHYFPGERRRAPDGLPPTISGWLRHGSRTPLVVRRNSRRLVARFFAPRPDDGAAGLILLEDHVAPALVSALQEMGLSAREAQVLAEVEKGLSNDDIAATLAISPHTVRKHLENIYGKLGVKSRTAALARLRSVTK